MWAFHHQDCWPDLDAVEEPTDVGRVLLAGGFILADPFESLLRHISQGYIQAAWVHVSALLTRTGMEAADLSWGFFHSGETHVSGVPWSLPSNYVGWTSRHLATFDRDPRFSELDASLAQMQPRVRCAVGWRSLKWHIAPDDYPRALRLIEALCTDEPSDWSPHFVLEHFAPFHDPWIDIARALVGDNQQDLNEAVEVARATYSPLGFRIVLRGYAAYLATAPEHLTLQLPMHYL